MGAVLVLADAFWINQGVISLLVALWAILIGLPRGVLARKFAGARLRRAGILAIYVAAAATVWTCNWANNLHARQEAEVVIAAVKAFRADNQRYPRTLGELVPRYVDAVPRAKYTLSLNHFTYLPAGEAPLLYYVALPPFGRPTYSFATGRWGYLD